jgi:hypothetical protein
MASLKLRLLMPVNYEVQSLNSTFKIGASNIGGREYGQVLGAGLIGQQIFASGQ